LLLLGPSGVGKTETAKVLADLLFGPGAMTRIDMSELSESHGVAQLFGAPPGYIGYGKGGILTEALRRHPYQLILLDEIEKAHPEVLLSLLPFLDEGRVRDATGREIEAPDALIVMTSNLGALAGDAGTRARVGFGESLSATEFDEAKCLSAARASLPAELWNRFDEVLVYGALDEAACLAWTEGAFQTLATQVRERTAAEVTIAEGAAERLLASSSLDGSLGIRHLRRAFAQQVEAWVSRRLLSGAPALNAPWCLDIAPAL
jgi:ATP-dependent Clp protease ATP-binding subunit ClpC